jgi:integrase
MTVIRVKGFQIFKDRHGRTRCYHRKTRQPVDLIKAPIGTPEFFAECARIAALATRTDSKPGTLGLLIQTYKSSAAFTDLAPRTKVDYQRGFDYLRPIEGTPLVKFDRALIVRLRDKAVETRGRRHGNYIKSILSIVFAWGSERGFVADNPASGIKQVRRKKGLPDPNRPWSDEERHAVLHGVPSHMCLPIALMMFTGLGPKDALVLPRSFYKRQENEIATRRSKTSEPVYWPCPSPLTEILNSTPSHDALTLCANSYGRPWTVSGFNSSWKRVHKRLQREGAIGPGLTLYGLRHTVAVILRESGADERTIADALGQAEPKMALHYAQGADLKPKMRGVVKSFEAELEKRKPNKSVKPTP